MMTSLSSRNPEIMIEQQSGHSDDSDDEPSEYSRNQALELAQMIPKMNSVEIACPLTSIMEDEEEYETKTPFRPNLNLFQTQSTQKSERVRLQSQDHEELFSPESQASKNL